MKYDGVFVPHHTQMAHQKKTHQKRNYQSCSAKRKTEYKSF
jgi:hypothetical protein